MVKMRLQLVPVLLLLVALSRALTAPLHSVQLLGQTNDNTLRNKYDIRTIYNTILCKEALGTFYGDDSLKPCSYYRQRGYQISEDRRQYESGVDKNDNYDGEGFRKEQWHNYPRQLDRLQHSPYDRNKPSPVKQNFDPDNLQNSGPDSLSNYLTTNEYMLTNDAPQNVYDTAVASSSPLLILKIRLACLNTGKVNRTLADAARAIMARLDANELKKLEDGDDLIGGEYGSNEVLPVERRDSADGQDIDILVEDNTSSPERLPIQKRLFSLWSRLQSLSHKGHELHHRRHMHFLGLPNALGGEVALTAETRAALMRPPGSPLRWG